MTESLSKTTPRPVRAGDYLVAYGERRPAERLFIHVTRVAKDGTWADIKVMTWAVMWKKRQKLDERGLPPDSQLRSWGQRDLDEQEEDHMAKLRETGALR